MTWRRVHCRCHDFRFYVTLFPKCFSNFRSRYLFAICLPTLYLTLADTYLPLHTAFPSSATRLSPSMKQRFLAQRATTDLGLNTPIRGCFQHCLLCTLNFTSPPTNHKRQFVPHFDAFNTPIRHWVRSLFGRPSLRESRLFSFPPLNNMLKFGG